MSSTVTRSDAAPQGWSPWWGWLVGMVIAAAVALVTRKLSGLYLAAVTLLFAIAFEHWLGDATTITGGASGISGIPVPALFGWNPPRYVQVVSAIAFVCVVAVFIDRLRRSAWGLVLSAARENAPAVQSTGISPAHLTVVALASGAAIASTGGALFTASVRAVTPETFGLDLVFLAIFMPIIGGRGSAWGAPLGALIVVGVSLNMPGQCRPDRRTRRLGGAANAELFTDDGWIRLGDIVEVDDSDRLRVVGRLADLIICGGKNISALEVEDFIREHPAVEMVAAVGVPDPLFGERLCAAVTLAPGTDQLSLADLNAWLRAQGITREYLPERLRVLASMPLAPGGKVAKAQVEQLVETSTGDDDDGRRNQR